MGLFRRRPDPYRDPQPFTGLPMEPRERVPQAEDGWTAARERTPTDWQPKPEELIHGMEWSRQDRRDAWRTAAGEPPQTPEPAVELLTVPWQITPPTQPGAYWTCERNSTTVSIAAVTRFGGRLCLRERVGDTCTYRAVESLQRFWAGPFPIPERMTLDDLHERDYDTDTLERSFAALPIPRNA